MRSQGVRWSALVGAVAAISAIACGDDVNVICGEGTIVVMGQCVPDPATACGPGTVQVEGVCIPDGSVVCQQGTVYDPGSGVCVVDDGACAAGTVLVGNRCVPFDDTLVGDVSEPDEPNDLAGTPGRFDLPAIDEGAVTLDGCIVPADFDGDGDVDPDFDSFLFTVVAPTLIQITIDGKGGASAGFWVGSTDLDLIRDRWERYGVDLTSDGASRRVFLPKAGTYALAVADSRSLLFDSPAGGPDACYFAQIERLPLPTPTDLPTPGLNANGTLGDPQFFRFAGPGSDNLQFVEMVANHPGVRGAVVVQIAGAYSESAIADDRGISQPVLRPHHVHDDIVVVVDSVLNIAFEDVPWHLEVIDFGVQAEPGDGSPVALTQPESMVALLTFLGHAGQVIRYQFDPAGASYRVFVVEPSFQSFIGQVCNLCSAPSDIWMQLRESGVYFVSVVRPDLAPGTPFSVAFERTAVVPTELTINASTVGNLAQANRAWFELDAAGADWLQFAVTPTAGAGFATAEVKFFDRRAQGEIETGRPPIQNVPLLDPASAATAPFGRILLAGTDRLLLSVEDSAGHNGDEAFSVSVTPRDFVDLGTIVSGAMASRDNDTVTAGGTRLYLARGTPGDELTVTVSPANPIDVVVEQLDRTEAVVQTANASTNRAEQFTARVGDEGFVAFAVRGAAGEAGAITIKARATTP
jgi:hypothetical protein